MAEHKTNVIRLLVQKKIPFQIFEYPHDGTAVDGLRVAELTGLDPETVFKTMVCRGASKTIYVFCLPVTAELDLKRAAKAAAEKSVAMVSVSEINGLTGYVRGGCSPIGMKKQYRTFLHASALCLPQVVVSAGRIGLQIGLAPDDLIKISNAKTADIISED